MSEPTRAEAKTSEAKKENVASQKQNTDLSLSIKSPEEQILFLQRTIGNEAVGRLIRSGALRAKLRIWHPGDMYEQEADRVPDQKMRMPDPEVSTETKASNNIQDNSIQQDFSHVRVHTGSHAAETVTSGTNTEHANLESGDIGTGVGHQVDSKSGVSLGQPDLSKVLDSKVPGQTIAEDSHSNKLNDGVAIGTLPDFQTNEKQTDVIAQNQPIVPESPILAHAVELILEKAEVEKAKLSQTAQAHQNALMQQADAITKTIEGTTQRKIQAIITEIDGKKAGVKQTISTTKALIKGQLASQRMAALAEGSKAPGALRKEVETKRKAAIEVSETEARQTDQTGQIEAKRVMTSSAESSSRVNAIANQKAISSSSKPEVQSTVRQALVETASDVTSKMHQRSQDLANNAREASQKTSKGLHDAGKQLASGIGSNTSHVEKAIQDGTNATVNQIATQELQYQQKQDALQLQALTSLEKLKASSIAGIKQSGQIAATAASKTYKTATTQINKAKAASLQQLDKGIHQVVVQLNQVLAGRKVDNKGVEKIVQEVGNKLQQANVKLGMMIADKATSSQTSLNQLGDALPGHLDRMQQKVNAVANKATSSLNSGLAAVPAQITQASQQAISENKITNQQAVQQFGNGLQQQIDKAKLGWSQESQKVSNDIRGKIDEGVKSNKEIGSKAPADFTELAHTAAAKAEESLVSKIFSGIWEGIKKVAIGLAIFVAVVLVITGVVLVVAAIAGIAVVASEVLLAVAAIVGVGFLLYGFITAMIKRSDDFWKAYGTNIPWYEKVLGFFVVFEVAIGDTFGVTPIIEGIAGKEVFTGKEFNPEQQAEKITEGVLTIALIFIIGRILKSLGKPGEIKPPEGKPGEVKPGEVKPGEVKPGEVKPDKTNEIPVDPNKYNPKTRTDAELQLDKDPTTRPGETPQEAAERARMAENEIVERVMERYNGLGEKPPHVDMAANDAAHTDAHTGQRHGPNIPEARSLDANGQPDGTRTIEGRIHGDPPWNQPGDGGQQSFSAKWLSQDILNQTVNRYLRNNWEQIRSDLALEGKHSNSFDAGQIVGKGYFNKNFGQPGGSRNPISQGPAVTPMVFIAIKFVPGNPPSFYVITTYPTLRGF
jgi:hypothetical protein